MGKKKLYKGFGEEVRTEIGKAQNGKCKRCRKDIVDFHHMLHNTKVNRKLFPLLIDSVFNCVGLCRDCHDNHKHKYRISLGLAAVYEYALNKLKMDLFRQ